VLPSSEKSSVNVQQAYPIDCTCVPVRKSQILTFSTVELASQLPLWETAISPSFSTIRSAGRRNKGRFGNPVIPRE